MHQVAGLEKRPHILYSSRRSGHQRRKENVDDASGEFRALGEHLKAMRMNKEQIIKGTDRGELGGPTALEVKLAASEPFADHVVTHPQA